MAPVQQRRCVQVAGFTEFAAAAKKELELSAVPPQLLGAARAERKRAARLAEMLEEVGVPEECQAAVVDAIVAAPPSCIAATVLDVLGERANCEELACAVADALEPVFIDDQLRVPTMEGGAVTVEVVNGSVLVVDADPPRFLVGDWLCTVNKRQEAESILDQLESATILECEIERVPGIAAEESQDDEDDQDDQESLDYFFDQTPGEFDIHQLQQLNPNLPGLQRGDQSDGGSDGGSDQSDGGAVRRRKAEVISPTEEGR